MARLSLAAALSLLLAGVAAADRYDDIAARALAEAIHMRSSARSEFIPAPPPRRPTVSDSFDRFEQPIDTGEPRRVVKKAKKAPAKKTVVRRVIQEPVYYAPPMQFGGGGFSGGFSGGSCGPGG